MATAVEVLSLFIHMVIVTGVAFTVSITTNIRTLFVVLILVTLTYLQTLYFDGCLLSKIDGKVPFTDYKANTFVSCFFGLKEGDIRLENLEKVLLGITTVFVLFKIWAIAVVEAIYGMPFLDAANTIAGAKKPGVFTAMLSYLF